MNYEATKGYGGISNEYCAKKKKKNPVLKDYILVIPTI